MNEPHSGAERDEIGISSSDEDESDTEDGQFDRSDEERPLSIIYREVLQGRGCTFGPNGGRVAPIQDVKMKVPYFSANKEDLEHGGVEGWIQNVAFLGSSG